MLEFFFRVQLSIRLFNVAFSSVHSSNFLLNVFLLFFKALFCFPLKFYGLFQVKFEECVEENVNNTELCMNLFSKNQTRVFCVFYIITYASLFFIVDVSNLFLKELTLSLVLNESFLFFSSGNSEKTTVLHFLVGSTFSASVFFSSA